MKLNSLCGLAGVAMLSLTACGTSTETGVPIGLSAPIETGAMQQERQENILKQATSLVISTVHSEIVWPDSKRTLRLRTVAEECSGSRCELLEPTTGSTGADDLKDAEIVLGDAEALGSAHGITLTLESLHTMGTDDTSFGAWMEHGAFVLTTDHAVVGEANVTAVYGVALGTLTDRALTESATWAGLMVGTPTAGDDQGDRLIGTAALRYDMSTGMLDAGFSEIRNIERGKPHSVDSLRFSNLAVGSDGTFSRGQSGTRIQGGFYGPDHAEAAGIFEQSDIVGAFGAMRQ